MTALAARAAVGPDASTSDDRGFHGSVQRILALRELVDEADPLRADRVEPATTREQRPRMRLADLRDDER